MLRRRRCGASGGRAAQNGGAAHPPLARVNKGPKGRSNSDLDDATMRAVVSIQQHFRGWKTRKNLLIRSLNYYMEAPPPTRRLVLEGVPGEIVAGDDLTVKVSARDARGRPSAGAGERVVVACRGAGAEHWTPRRAWPSV